MRMTHLRRSIVNELSEEPLTADQLRRKLGHNNLKSIMVSLKSMVERGALDFEYRDVVDKAGKPRSLRFYTVAEDFDEYA